MAVRLSVDPKKTETKSRRRIRLCMLGDMRIDRYSNVKLSSEAGNEQTIRNERLEGETKGIKVSDVQFTLKEDMGRKVVPIKFSTSFQENSRRLSYIGFFHRKARGIMGQIEPKR